MGALMGHIEPGRKAGGRQAAVIAVALIVCAASAYAQSGPALAADPTVCEQGPNYIRLTRGDALSTYYPVGALQRGVQGRTVMECGATSDGHVADCLITEEDPKGFGFGAAALSVAKYYRVRGMCPGAKVVIPINWRLR